jgi:hypothetical protein
MSWPRGPLLARHSFKLGDVFPADDRMAAYVMRLSMALGDLRIVAEYATRKRHPAGEHIFFVRLFTLHMREMANLVDPPDRTIVPTIDEFLAALPRGTQPSRTVIRRHHAKVMRRLNEPMTGRDKIEIKRRGRPSVWRVPTLRDELKRIRDDFAHYGHNKRGAVTLTAAMKSAKDIRTGYVVRERFLRAQYADTVALTITHPFDLDARDLALDMHGRIVDLVGPMSSFINSVEAAWLRSRPPGVVTTKRYQ